MTLAERTLPRPRDVLGEFGIYVHVPFCVHRCWYCDFNTYAGLDHLAPVYMRALARHAREAADGTTVTSIFFGGGTPSLVDADALLAVLDAIRDAWPVALDCEISVECNPETVDLAKLRAYRDGGVTRLSFGVQSLHDRLLAALGRTHDAATAIHAIRTAHRAGFDDVNADLIFGVPGEDDATWTDTLRGVIALEPSHVSCYGLTYEQGTPLEAWRRLGKVTPVPDDDVARRWETADDMLAAAGYPRYEISNWGRPCRHNELYWRCGEYAGIGAGAHSHLDGVRSWNVKAPAAYIAGMRIAGSERIDAHGRRAETMFLGLRRVAGVRAADFEALNGVRLEEAYAAQLADSARKGLLEWDGQTARLTRRGTLLANEVVGAFLDG
jgi:oxygen-independent coproporphyrinogen-3 oxidase